VNVAREADAVEFGGLIAGGQRVNAGRGFGWIQEGFSMFLMAPGMWIAITVIYFVLTVLLSVIPFLGSLALMLLMPVLVAGVMLGCRDLEQGEPLQADHLFAGFKENVGSLVLVGLLYLVGLVLIVVVVGIAAALGVAGVFAAGMDKEPTAAMIGMWAIGMLVIVGLSLPLVMAVWFAPALVVFHEQEPLAAMRQSFSGCLKNILPFFVYSVIWMVLSVVATIPLGLGWLVLGPITFASVYYSYRDIFCAP
jgi:uncharacterized membrane protein